jgi:glycerophosphoryl diester phosphodiesterase
VISTSTNPRVSKIDGNDLLLLGHRGARGIKNVPENTFASFDLALAQGCDGIEFDVRLSEDGIAVICHDDTIRSLKISRCPAQSLDLPFLRDVLDRYQNTAFLDIELKVPSLEQNVIDLLRAHPPRRGFVVSSFLPEVLTELHNLDASVPLGLICETKTQLSMWDRLPIFYVIPHSRLLSQQLIQEVHWARKKMLVWTVNTPASMKRFASWAVDGIISDHPERLAASVGRRSPSKR